MTSQPESYIPRQQNYPVKLTYRSGAQPQEPGFEHLFAVEDIDAINAALACARPLLLTGEPGVGKTQLAQAAAVALKRAFVRFTVDAKTEPRDLLWRFDAVARLAKAQVANAEDLKGEALKKAMAMRQFLRPGPLWWAYEWGTAKPLAEGAGDKEPPMPGEKCSESNGVVVLIDEIDKAEIDVPNGLLEALGEGRFQPEGHDLVSCGDTAPLIIVTSNRERTLPDAFLRRCLVHRLALPEDRDELIELLVRRGQAHAFKNDIPETVFRQAAEDLYEDRKQANAQSLHPLPGQAEYLDLLRTIDGLLGRPELASLPREEGENEFDALRRTMGQYVLRKRAVV